MAHDRISYARSGDVSIAYQVVGDGPRDIVMVPGWVSNLEAAWEDPDLARAQERLASFSRLILFDKRGTGLSDRVPASDLPSLETRMDDVRAVMDVVGSERAALFGSSEGGSMALLFAATYPERTTALMGFGMFASRRWSPEYPWAPTTEQREAWLSTIENDWGGVADLGGIAPSRADDERYRAWFGSYIRRSASPGSAVALGRMNTDIDVRAVLSTISVPTLVMHRVGDRDANVEEARYIAARIPGAKLVEFPGEDHVFWTQDVDAIVDEIEEFLTGVRRGPEPDRVLATVLFTDIVGSTARAVKMGDRQWMDALEAHRTMVRWFLERFRGHEVDTAGDGFFATFDGPARAIRCALAVLDAARERDIDIRAGLHTGEVEMGEKPAGVAVHIGARVMSEAGAGEVLVSQTVKDLVAGSGLSLEERGPRALKGVPGVWDLFRVVAS
jgi:pimeloyl-ACP methyl ester carboxylesterase